ncbi:peptidyl-prolyl cis-trans isomerase D [Pseudidiomarina indica]|uniref:Periplasmic chaperone PpiD n=1 Tax=Pseudidiomarina indica TaxID=1159017 RepID=A0A1G6DN75_9GAMM|nr:peptidylprolyl isomerase [Pseudidiomarina indica]SDB46571.1 peptidyl-prolyl cis-trans isomerase D [Pseudidiomarina indica]
MLEKIREGANSKVFKGVLIFIALSFALTGVGGYITSQPEPAIAEVNGQDITRIEFDRAVDSERARQQQQLGDFYASLATDPAFNQQLRQRVLDDLINAKLIEMYANDLGLRVSDAQVIDAIRNISAFQVAGQFDNTTYQMTLRGLGYTPDSFAETMRSDLARSQLIQSLIRSEFALPNEAAAMQRLLNQKRSGAYRIIELDDYLAAVEVTDEQIQQWYQLNQQRFNVAEQVKVEFVALDADALADSIEIDETAVQEWFEQNKERYETSDQYRFAHILIDAEREDAEARAQEVLAQLTDGADFAAVAAEYSDDIFTSDNGGDLDFIEPGIMDPAFDDAAFALQEVGDMTGVVATSFGYHIIQLTDIERGQAANYDEVREEIVAQMRQDRLRQAYYELQQKVSTLAFDVPDTLQPVADETDVLVRTSDWFSRDNAPTALNHPAVFEQLFNRDFIDEGLNSDLIEVNDKQAVVVRVVDYQPAYVRPLEEVRAEVLNEVRTEQAQLAARIDAEAIAEQLRQGEATTQEMLTIESIERRDMTLPPAVVQSLFAQAVPAENSVQVAVTELAQGAIAVVQLTAVEPGEVDESIQSQLVDQLLISYTNQGYGTFLQALRDQADIKIRINTRSGAVEE